ncbi:MAG: ATP-binding cassette domain-containing protein [Chitinivibrionales bacterium]|nr:ATP-binding cassette domain-containing protein [Chitinivibrionales bacterium]
MHDQPLLSMNGISKRFGAVQALNRAFLNVKCGEVHALIGENGAGKSTLMKILSGACQPDSGSLVLDGKPISSASPAEARSQGIAMVYQELNLVPHLSVEENITLGREQHRFGFVPSQAGTAKKALALLGHDHLYPLQRAATLSIAEQQIVEIARALAGRARLIIMDEPTSSLAGSDTRALFTAIRTLKQTGVTIIYISHFLEEVREIADGYTVLRDGQSVAHGSMQEASLPQIIAAMVGRTLTELFPHTPHETGEEIVRVSSLTKPPRVLDVNFAVRRGEILGLAGLVGSGRTEVLRALFGLDTATQGCIRFANGIRIGAAHLTPRIALKNGLDLLSENRREEGLAIELSLRDNISLASLARFLLVQLLGLIHRRGESAEVSRQCDALAIKRRSIMQKVADLSGGNQQKVALARILTNGADIILLDEPTRGIDVGSKVEIYRLIGQLASQGKGVIMVSSYLPELLGMCDSLAVMHRGRMSPVQPVGQWSEQRVMAWATSGRDLTRRD